MKITQALQAQKAIAAEIVHLRSLEQQRSWSYRSLEHPDAELQPNFDFDKNHEVVRALSKLHTKLGQAIARTNLTLDIVGIDDSEFVDWI